MSWIAHIVRHALIHWGYLALLAGLIGEDAGLPLPGETVLMFASFLAHKTGRLSLSLLIVTGIAAAIAGDNIGFAAGRWLGPRLLRWLRESLHMQDDVAAARDQIERHGPATVFWARYIFGLRTIAGPVAGALGMKWKKFFLFNALGAVTWVAAIAATGWAFASEFSTLLAYSEKATWIIAGAVFGAGYFFWRRKKKRLKERSESSA